MKSENSNDNFVASRIRSFGNALKGIPFIVKEKNFWIHVLAAILACIAAYYFRFHTLEWCILVFCIGFIFSLEGINTAIEYLVDLVSPDHNVLAGKVKDISSGAVLLGAIAVCVIGIILFGRHLI